MKRTKMTLFLVLLHRISSTLVQIPLRKNSQKKEARNTRSFFQPCQYGFIAPSAYINRHTTTIYWKARNIKGKAEERR